MEKNYLSLLDSINHNLVQRIEQTIGVPITIEVDTLRKNKLACDVCIKGAKLFIPEPDYFPNDSVYHELLHLRRLCIDKVPRIILCEDYFGNPVLESAMTSLDNDIEHLLIVPEELSEYPSRCGYWKAQVENIFDNYQNLGLRIEDQERRVLINWAFIHHVFPFDDIMGKANMVVNKMGIKERANSFFADITLSTGNKENLVKMYFKHLFIPIEAGCLEYLDFNQKRRYEMPMKEA